MYAEEGGAGGGGEEEAKPVYRTTKDELTFHEAVNQLAARARAHTHLSLIHI